MKKIQELKIKYKRRRRLSLLFWASEGRAHVKFKKIKKIRIKYRR